MSNAEFDNDESKFQDTWRKFIRALHSTEDFNSFFWIKQLMYAAFHDCICFLERKILSPYLRWKAIIPVLSICLILLVIVAFFMFYDLVVEESWCNDRSCMNNGDFCAWGVVHVILVIYLSTMVFWNFFITVFTSPGVALPKLDYETEDKTKIFKISFKSSTKQKKTISWKSFEGRGGFLCFNPLHVNISDEMRMTNQFTPSNNQINAYKQIITTPSTTPLLFNINSSPLECFPSPLPSFCHKCNIVRPPRCRHCKLCNRCILQVRKV